MKRLMVMCAALAMPAAAVAQNADSSVRQITASPAYRAAAEAINKNHDQWVADIVKLTEIPSPPFKEQARAKAFADMLRARGLDPKIDPEGNVLALRKGTTAGPVVV